MPVGLESEAKFMGLNTYPKLLLKKLSEVFRRLFGKPTSNSSEHSTLCRFIFQSNHFSGNRVKPGAFLPAPGKTRISMFFVDLMQTVEIWKLGDVVGSPRGKTPKARAEMHRDAIHRVEDCKLQIEHDPQPHPRHVNVVGWPVDKDAQKAVAIELCRLATLHVR
jgi:hypothetical protein